MNRHAMSANPRRSAAVSAARVRQGAFWLWLAGLVALALVLQLAATGPARAQLNDRPDSFADLAERLLPAVVNISTTQSMPQRDGPEIPEFPEGSPFEEFFRDFLERQERNDAPQRRANSLGSGFIVDSEGIVVTNYHVIEGADEITVILQDDTNLKAEVVGHDDKTDIAVLRVETDEPLPAVDWGDSNDMRVGDWILAIGNPFGLGGTVTAGIVSARQRDINAGPYVDYLQTDASINRGNSGGPMFNLDGDVIGINTAIYSPSGGSVGIGFAIPSAQARVVVDQLLEFGRTRRGWLGVRIQQVTDDIAESLELANAMGALVASVTPTGPAEDAGIQQGDVIIRFDGKEVTTSRALPRIVAETPVGKAVSVEVWRGGESVEVPVTLGELEEAEDQGLLAAVPPGGGVPDEEVDAELSSLGLGLADMTPDLRDAYDIADDVAGVVITDIEPGSTADERGLQPGEVIVEIGQEVVSSAAEVVEKVQQARDAGRKSVLLLVEREGELRFVALSIQQS